MRTTFPTAEAAALMLQTTLPRACPADMDDAVRFVQGMVEDRVERLVEWTSSRRDDGSLRGIVAVSEGRFERELWMAADPECDDTEWFGEALNQLPSFDTRHVSSVVDPQHQFAREALGRRGFGIAKVFLDGHVAAGLRHVEACASPDGFSFEGADDEDVEAITASRVSFFRRHWQRCFGTDTVDESFLEQIEESQRTMVEAAVADGTETLWTIRHRDHDRIVGSFGLAVHNAHPLFGAVAGVDLNLDDDMVGRGLSRAMYRTMLRRASDLGIERYRGTTWNPAVLHLAGPLERWVAGWFLRKTGPLVEELPVALRDSRAHMVG